LKTTYDWEIDVSFLTDWIKDHILKTDKNYESFFKKNNILG
jgi:hemerythrin